MRFEITFRYVVALPTEDPTTARMSFRTETMQAEAENHGALLRDYAHALTNCQVTEVKRLDPDPEDVETTLGLHLADVWTKHYFNEEVSTCESS